MHNFVKNFNNVQSTKFIENFEVTLTNFHSDSNFSLSPVDLVFKMDSFSTIAVQNNGY